MSNQRYAVFCTVMVTIVFFTMDAFAQNVGFTRSIFQRHTEKLILLEDGMNLSWQSLPGIFISRAVDFAQPTVPLRNIDFSNCDLHYSDLSETDFIDCSFRSANLGGVITTRYTFFTGCDFTDAHITRSSISLTKEQLMTTGSYKRKDLIGCWFQGDFSGVDFSGFDLSGARFISAKIDGCDFSNAKISATALYHSIPPKTIIGNLMTREQLMSTKDFRQGCVLNVTFSGFDFSELDLSGMNFTGCIFGLANFHNTSLTNSVFSDCIFSGTKNLTLDQIKSTWNYKVGRMEGVILPKELQEALDAEHQAESELLKKQ